MDDYVVGVRKEDLPKDSSSSPFSTKSFLQRTKVTSLFPENRTKIITVGKDQPCSEGFKLLIENSILSVPVVDERTENYVGFLDMLDFVSFIAEMSQDEALAQTASKQIEEMAKMKSVSCGQLIGKSGRNPWYPVEENAPLLQAIQTMVDHKVHRIPVVSNTGEMQTIVTQSHVVSLISKNIAEFPVASKRIGDLKLGYKNVITVQKNELAIHAFKLIYDRKVSGVAVVDENGELFGNISASDIRFIESDASGIRRLFATNEEFINNVPKRPDQVPGPYFVRPSSTVEEVIMKLTVTKAHRVYVVDDLGGKRNPIGVVSLADVLETIVHAL